MPSLVAAVKPLVSGCLPPHALAQMEPMHCTVSPSSVQQRTAAVPTCPSRHIVVSSAAAGGQLQVAAARNFGTQGGAGGAGRPAGSEGGRLGGDAHLSALQTRWVSYPQPVLQQPSSSAEVQTRRPTAAHAALASSNVASAMSQIDATWWSPSQLPSLLQQRTAAAPVCSCWHIGAWLASLQTSMDR